MFRRFAAVLLPVLTLTTASSAAQFVVLPRAGTRVTVLSKSRAEKFEGSTETVKGWLSLDPAAVGDTISIHLEVDISSLNRDLYRTYLETPRYPRATFDGARVLGPPVRQLEPRTRTPIDVEGTFNLHGVSRPLRTTIHVTWVPASDEARTASIKFETTFPVALADYGVVLPELLALKMPETEQVNVSGIAVPAEIRGEPVETTLQ